MRCPTGYLVVRHVSAKTSQHAARRRGSGANAAFDGRIRELRAAAMEVGAAAAAATAASSRGVDVA